MRDIPYNYMDITKLPFAILILYQHANLLHAMLTPLKKEKLLQRFNWDASHNFKNINHEPSFYPKPIQAITKQLCQ